MEEHFIILRILRFDIPIV